MTDKGPIERIARAICQGDPDDLVPTPIPLSRPAGEMRASTPKQRRWEEYVPAARAALQAIRAPSEAMIEAGESVENRARWADEVWQAMIDTALEEDPTRPI